MNRISTIDMCRGLLFVLMANTHALSLARVGQDHWLRSDFWLPNGWATVAFVVLSGYGAGYLLSERRPELLRDRALRRRGIEILAVMLASNLAFALLRKFAEHELASVFFQPAWWLGFVTLETEWTISGVLLPTALLLLLAPRIMRGIACSPYTALGALLACQLALSMLKTWLPAEPSAGWLVRLLLTEGLGGFPVLPFLLNGGLGVWIGMAHRQRPERILPILLGLAALQLLLYASTWWPDSAGWRIARDSVGPLGKFACIFLLAMVCAQGLPRRLGAAIELVGRFALGSFVMHRVFLQALAIGLAGAGAAQTDPALNYALLFAGTLTLSWLLCQHRQSWPRVDLWFRRFAM